MGRTGVDLGMLEMLCLSEERTPCRVCQSLAEPLKTAASCSEAQVMASGGAATLVTLYVARVSSFKQLSAVVGQAGLGSP
jgi:hypothetical protein